jgi:hypothetical protein
MYVVHVNNWVALSPQKTTPFQKRGSKLRMLFDFRCTAIDLKNSEAATTHVQKRFSPSHV